MTDRVVLSALLALVLCSCLPHPNPGGIGTSPSVVKAAREVALRYVSCMAEPPPFDAIDWPTPDSVGNVILHASTVDRVKGAYADLRRYVTEQYFRCLHVAEAAGEQAVTVEVEP